LSIVSTRTCKVSIAVPVTKPKGGQFDGRTLKGAVADVESNTGVEVRRIHVDKGYRGHDYPNRFRVFVSGQVRRTTAAIKREMKRQSTVEPVIGHLKAGHRMDRNYLKGQHGDRINAVLAAAGFNFHLLPRWLAALLRAIFLVALQSPVSPQPA
jgi:IS5 family transposase